MSERWVSASGLKRALLCPASTVLVRSKKSFSASAESASDFGTLAHEYVENGTIYEQTEEWCSRFTGRYDRERLYPARGMHEVVGWYNPVNGEMGLRPPGETKRKHRDYADIPDHCIVGTIDFLCRAKDGRWWVDDLKTGNSMWLPKPDSDQMLFATMLTTLIFDTPSIATITAVPRYPLGTEPDRKRHDVSKPDALLYKDKLDILYGQHLLELRRAKEDNYTYVRNKECMFCPSRTICPIGIEVDEERALRKLERETHKNGG